MTSTPVTRLRPRTSTGYTDQAALNDIHALLTTSPDPASGQLEDIGLILARSGRPLIPVRPIEMRITETPTGHPVVRALSGDTTITIRQEPAGPGLLIEITTSPAETTDDVTVTINGHRLHHPAPAGGHTA